jgi:ABC-type phosphate transport system substrate-binding protein
MSKKLIAALLLGCLTALIPRSAAQAADVAVVVNANSRLTNVSVVDLRKIFAGEKRTWPGGVPIKLIIRAPGSHERLVLLRVLLMSEREYKQYWSVQTFRGEAESEPFTAPSLGMTLEAVRIFAGAITLVDVQDIKPGMKVVKLDGHMPGEPGYALR